MASSNESKSDDSTPNSTKTSFSVDELHDKVDAFVLSVFEAIRGHPVAQEGAARLREARASKAVDVRAAYAAATAAADGLIGVNRTAAEQDAKLDEQSAELRVLKTRILANKKAMLCRQKELDTQLRLHLSDEVLGLTSAPSALAPMEQG